MLIYDEHVASSYTDKGFQKDRSFLKHDNSKCEGKFRFLIPEDLDWLQFAETLKNAAENKIDSELNADKGWVLTSTVKYIFRLFFGTKSFKPQG